MKPNFVSFLKIILCLFALCAWQGAYATPTTPTSDFIDNGDGTVTHKKTDLNDGLVAYWSFNDCTAKDNSGNGHNGAINGSPQCVDSVRGKGFSFNGVSDFIDFGNILTRQCQFAISTWVNVAKRGTSMPQYFGIFGQQSFSYPPNSSPYVFFIGDSQESFGSSSNWIDGKYFDTRVSHTIPTNDWHLITQTYDGKVIKQFDNDKLISTLPSENYCLGNNDSFLIGKTAAYPTFLYTSYFNGSIDEFRIYNRALSDSEIAQLYAPKAVLLLHGMNSTLKAWNDLVASDAGFDKQCTNLNLRKNDSKNISPVANSEGVYCFRMNFGTFDNHPTAPTGLDGKPCVENNGCSGDYSTFETLGLEISMAINRIKSKLGDNTQIILLGHSRGGLAARAFLQGNYAEKSNVAGLITTGTPHAGSPLGRYYFYLNDNCTPESEHDNLSDGCYYDWDFANAVLIKYKGGLDMKAPTIGFLAEPSTDFKKRNPYAIETLNMIASNLPDIKYTQLFYSGINFGCLGGMTAKGCGYDTFSKTLKSPSQEGLDAVLNGRTRESLDGDGIVPESSQKISELSGFSFAVSSGNRKRTHIAEPKDITGLSNALNDMYKSLGWIQ